MKFERYREWLRHVASAGILVGLVACAEDDITWAKGEPTVHVSPPSAIVSPGDSVRFTAELLSVSDKRVVWSSSQPSVATVGSTGLVRAHSLGRATVFVHSVPIRSLRGAVTVDVR